MIEIKQARNVPGFRFCPVCRTRLAPKGSNVRVTVDAENEAHRNRAHHAQTLRTDGHRLHPRSRLHACRARGGRHLG